MVAALRSPAIIQQGMRLADTTADGFV